MDTLTADMLAEALQEPKKALLARVLRTIGQERCQAIFADTLTIESSGGMLVKAGDRRRTPGGVFLHLVRQQCSKEERARLFPYRATKNPQQQPKQAQPDAAPMPLTLDLWKGLTPMAVTATLKLVLRDLPETRESNGLVYMALTNEPRGLPKGISLDSGPLFLSSPLKQWKTAITRAEQIRATGLPALLIVEAHVSTQEGALVGVVKGVQVVEGKAPTA
ncbi:MAG TPA: phosphorylated adapter RNA export RNA-binding domain-containing protein [Candidatus Tectomicrobia bacterium]